MFDLNRGTVSFLGIDYKIVEVLEKELLLVVRIDQLKDSQFPLQTYIIPDPIFSSKHTVSYESN